MKNILTLLFALLIPSTTFAETFKPNTHDSMVCMKLRQCKEDIDELLVDDYEGEINDILYFLDKLRIKVYKASSVYFIDDTRAIYFPDKNTIYLNQKYLTDDTILLKLLRHEGWHVAQDCMAGTIINSDLAAVLTPYYIPKDITEETIERYGQDPTVVRIEREAVLAADTFRMTSDALTVCNSHVPMWEVYEPPERTKSYLYINGFIED